MDRTVVSPEVFIADRWLHHELALAAYRQSFCYRNLTLKYQVTSFRRLAEVFGRVQIADPDYPTIKRAVDTFDLINPLVAKRLVEACYRDLLTKPSAIASLKVIDRYCLFLKDNPTLHQPGQKPLYLPSLYGAIESPVGLYAIPRTNPIKPPNFNYLTEGEYKIWLRFAWQSIALASTAEKKIKASQFYLASVIAGEMGLRLQEIIGLEPRHLNLKDRECMVMHGKGSKGSGHRKRSVPLSELAVTVIQEFLTQYPRRADEALFQTITGNQLSLNMAHNEMRAFKSKIQQAGLLIYLDKGFGWHAFRRTFTRLYLNRGGDIHTLKAITGWSFTSTISHYLGDPKPELTPKGFPLRPRRKA